MLVEDDPLTKPVHSSPAGAAEEVPTIPTSALTLRRSTRVQRLPDHLNYGLPTSTL